MPKDRRPPRRSIGVGASSTAPAGPVALTRSGAGVLTGGIVLIAGGWGLGYREPVALGLAGVFAVLAAVVWTLPAPGVAASRRLTPPRTVRGEHATATVTVRRTGRRVRRGLRLADRCGDRTVDVGLPVFGPERERVVDYLVPTPHRGKVAVGPLRVVATDPFGLCRRTFRFGAAESLIVRPRTVPLGVPASGRDPHLDGTTSDSVDSTRSAFHALRPYVPGDDRRLVHWRSTARTGTLIVRQMADVSRPHTTVLLDTDPLHYPDVPAGPSGDPDSEMFELAVDVCASVACAAARLTFPVRLAAGADQLPVGADGDADAVLDALAAVRLDAPGSLEQAVGALRRHRSGGSLVVVTGPGNSADTGGRSGLLHGIASLRHVFGHVVVVRAGSGSSPGANGSDTSGRTTGPGTGLGLGLGLAVLDVPDLSRLSAVWQRGFAR